MVLLDANALIALCWSGHVHHAPALAWFKTHAKQGWATCAFTQAAFVRVILQPAFSAESLQAGSIVELLARTTAHRQHHYLGMDFDMQVVQSTCTGGLFGHRQITDAWLLTTAMRHGARLATFDAGIASLLATPAERSAHVTLLKAHDA